MKINYLVLSSDKTIPFDALRRRGWAHPEGPSHIPLGDSMIKEHGRLEFQVVNHFGLPDPNWQEIFVHYKDGSIRKMGGTPFTVGEVIETLKWLENELNEALNLPKPGKGRGLSGPKLPVTKES